MEILQTRPMANSLLVFFKLGFIPGGLCSFVPQYIRFVVHTKKRRATRENQIDHNQANHTGICLCILYL
jgi:hypothetical protein